MERTIISFGMELAKKVGFENAGFLQDIFYWIGYNKSSGENFRDGRYWSYSTLEELQKRHPYWTVKQIQRIIKNCKENGWLLVGNYNRNPYDRTNWYSVSDEIIETIYGNRKIETGNVDITERENGVCQEQNCTCYQTGESIKYNNNIDNNSDNVNTYAQSEKIYSKSGTDFDAFWKAYPKKKNKIDAKKAFSKVKVPLQTLLDAIEKQKNSTQWKKDNGQYIPYPASWLRAGAWEDEVETQQLNDRYRIPSQEEYYEGWGVEIVR